MLKKFKICVEVQPPNDYILIIQTATKNSIPFKSYCVNSYKPVGPNFDNPKSHTLAAHSSSSKIFVVFTSRWMIMCFAPEGSPTHVPLQYKSPSVFSKKVVNYWSCRDGHDSRRIPWATYSYTRIISLPLIQIYNIQQERSWGDISNLVSNSWAPCWDPGYNRLIATGLP